MNDTRNYVISLLAQADLLNWISAGLSEPNDELFVRLAISESELIGLKSAVIHPYDGMWKNDHLIDYLNVISHSKIEEVREDFFRMFQGSTLCPPNESAYIRRDKGAILGDLCGFYRAFGFEIDAGVGERPDHIITELEFISLMLAKTAVLIRDNETHHLEVLLDATKAFANEHLNNWISSFSSRLNETAVTPFYQGLSIQLYEVWTLISAINHWGDVSNSETIELDKEQLNAFECGCV